jgi:uncharacterized membrane protein YcaP (DUF421 family)
MNPIFFDGLNSILRTLVMGVAGYAGIVLLLRASGKRTLSKMNMFDFIVTIALGSVLATMIISKQTTLAQGLTAVAVLVFMQFAVTAISVRSGVFSRLIKAEPRLLYANGDFLRGAMMAERVTKSELEAAARDASVGSMGEVAAMVLETDGTISVIPRSNAGDGGVVPPAKE